MSSVQRPSQSMIDKFVEILAPYVGDADVVFAMGRGVVVFKSGTHAPAGSRFMIACRVPARL
jgi:hypothetical protein